MKARTLIKCVEETIRANIIDTLVKPKRPERKDKHFLDLHVHLRLPTTYDEAKLYLDSLTETVDGVSINFFGRQESGVAKYEDFIAALIHYKPRHYSINNKGLVAVVKNGFTEKQTIILRGQEHDRTEQGLDITGVGITEYIDNPAGLRRSQSPDAREIADKFRKQGAFTFVEHFCSEESATLEEDQRKFWSRHLPWTIRTYQDKNERAKLFDVFDHVHAVEVHNGFVVLYMAPQNPLSQELFSEYVRKKGKKPGIAGSDTHLNRASIGRAGFFTEKLDPTGDGKEIVQQLIKNTEEGVELFRHHVDLISFFRSQKMLEEERKKLKADNFIILSP